MIRTRLKVALFAFFALLAFRNADSQAQTGQAVIIRAQRLNPTAVDVVWSNGERRTIDFYGDAVFRMFQDNTGGVIREPAAKPEAHILTENARRPVTNVDVIDESGKLLIKTSQIIINFDKRSGLMSVAERGTDKLLVEELKPAAFDSSQVTLTLNERPDEYFYGGGVQNGRFSHKGKAIAIENQNSWNDGGVASPTPFYWSTAGYAVMWHTFRKGRYDFASAQKGVVTLSHETPYLDVFFMFATNNSNAGKQLKTSEIAVSLLNSFYQLTGHPVLLPKFGFYEGHLNAYNRDYWVEDSAGIAFEDGRRYKESQKDNGGVRESLNGDGVKNYQFSARAVIDRYRNNDMPFGWLLPNDGYGAGYGQSDSLDGNIRNLKHLGDYAREHGVEIGLWTQSDLHPKEGVKALLQRDIVKEVRDAGVRVLKTDVAWVGAGYSFGLNGVADVATVMPYYGDDARPFIITLDGWAGTQRYAAVWTGDQTGGQWEYIRFHIPTYIGAGLSGQPNITSDMDGIFGGKNMEVNIRDFQWKTFTPMQLNMDGWGANPKYPSALGEPATSINRNYLKLKSELLPYTYSFAHEAITGQPLIRAMFIDYPNACTLGTATQYQFLYGPSFLVAPIYQVTKSAEHDVRNGIYLPEGTWIDYFSGERYTGGRVINSFDAPLWKLPLFVKSGAIIPMVAPNNNPNEIDPTQRIYELYPAGHSQICEYDDDGRTQAYLRGESVTTLVESDVDANNRLTVTIHPSQGRFEGFVAGKTTELRINTTAKPKKVSVKLNGKSVKLTELASSDELSKKSNAFFYDKAPNLNRFSTKGSKFADIEIIKNPQLIVKISRVDVLSTKIELIIDGYQYSPADQLLVTDGALAVPQAQITDLNTEAYRITPTWKPVANADYYEIEFNNLIYSTIRDTALLFDGLNAETPYTFRLRAVNRSGVSEWATVAATTKHNPLEWAIHGLSGECSVPNQGGHDTKRLFDFDVKGGTWHTVYGEKAVPFNLTIDLGSVNRLDRFDYLPREDAGNGTILKGKVLYSMDKNTWTDAGEFDWPRSGVTKSFAFAGQPTARYIKIEVTAAVGNFGSGRELYVFKVPGSTSWLSGDINNDGVVDDKDVEEHAR